jgi:hypothetical protein
MTLLQQPLNMLRREGTVDAYLLRNWIRASTQDRIGARKLMTDLIVLIFLEARRSEALQGWPSALLPQRRAPP